MTAIEYADDGSLEPYRLQPSRNRLLSDGLPIGHDEVAIFSAVATKYHDETIDQSLSCGDAAQK
jgi:hypothetical protein